MFKYLVLVVLSCVLYQDNNDSFVWSPNLELHWSDFKGNPQPRYREVALTASGIRFGLSTKKSDTELIDFSYQITAVFYPDKSWHINKPLSDNILDHERLHFDITELFARKFKKQISEYAFTMNINVEIERIYNTINTELDEMQKRYDVETNHSQNIEQQRKWQIHISLEIEKISYYQ